MSSLRAFLPLRPAFRRWLVWLLVGLAPLQGMAAAMLATLGPAHVHVAAADRLVLDDLRRAPVWHAAPVVHVATAFGHFHRSGEAMRHRHAVGDASVLVVGLDAAQQAGDGDGAGLAPALAAFPMIPSVLAWSAIDLGSSPASASTWAPQTHQPAFPERPPRAV